MILPGDPPVTIDLKRNARARRMTLRVSRLDGRVTLSVPKRLKESEARAFAEEKAPWIRKQLAAQPDVQTPSVGGHLLYQGELHPVVAGKGRAAKLINGRFEAPGDTETAPKKLAALLKFLARDRLVSASDHYAVALGAEYSAIQLRDTRSRWGSCSSQGKLMYSWRLIMAPPEVLDYVAAHEVAHLREMNHSAAFWNLVAQIYPDYETPRAWLRENGNQLHAWQF